MNTELKQKIGHYAARIVCGIIFGLVAATIILAFIADILIIIMAPSMGYPEISVMLILIDIFIALVVLSGWAKQEPEEEPEEQEERME
jgi:hypothetical protein